MLLSVMKNMDILNNNYLQNNQNNQNNQNQNKKIIEYNEYVAKNINIEIDNDDLIQVEYSDELIASFIKFGLIQNKDYEIVVKNTK